MVVGGSFSNELSHHDVQHIYQFRTYDPSNGGDLLLSPNPTSNNGGSEDDNPTRSRIVPPGDSIQVDLQINLTELVVNTVGGSFTLDPKENIRDAVDTGGSFENSITTVDLLDAITVENDMYS